MMSRFMEGCCDNLLAMRALIDVNIHGLAWDVLHVILELVNMRLIMEELVPMVAWHVEVAVLVLLVVRHATVMRYFAHDLHLVVVNVGVVNGFMFTFIVTLLVVHLCSDIIIIIIKNIELINTVVYM